MDNMTSLLNIRVQLWVSLKVIFAHAPTILKAQDVITSSSLEKEKEKKENNA